MGEMVLRWTPDPREIPPDSPLLIGGKAPVHLFEQLASRTRHDQANSLSRSRERADVRPREVAGDIERAPLTQILESNGEDERHAQLSAGERQRAHRRIVR